jgi:hypothetical protein
LHTWEPVWTDYISEPTWVFQNFMHLSAVPPPLATKFDCIGLQAMAFTAAWWEENLKRGIFDLC